MQAYGSISDSFQSYMTQLNQLPGSRSGGDAAEGNGDANGNEGAAAAAARAAVMAAGPSPSAVAGAAVPQAPPS